MEQGANQEKLKVYHHPACGTCRKAIRHLQALGKELDLVSIKENPPSEAELRRMIRQSGEPVRKWFNTSGEVYRAMGLKDKLDQMPEDEQIALLAENGMLIKRPVVTDGQRVTVGFREDMFTRVWDRRSGA
jgi:arsenate reductase